MATSTNPGALIALSLLLAACSNDEPANGPTVKYETVPTIEMSRSEATSNDGLNSFGIKIFNEVAKSDDPEIGYNFVVSPTSMGLCVSMIANACDKSTEQSIIDFMECNSLENINSVSKKLMRFLPDKSNKAVLTLANSVWHKADMIPSEDFKDRIARYYFGEITGVDFGTNEGVERINRWCRENTADVIEGFKPNNFSKYTRIVCLNSLYFAGEWREHFDTKDTKKQVFHGITEDAEVDMMYKEADMRYSENEKWESVIIPYEGSNHMIVFLPKSGTEVTELAASINDDDIFAATKKGELASVRLSMPKFDTKSATDLTKVIDHLGIQCKSNDIAGFSGTITEQSMELEIKYMQNTSITTDETGTVAASVSAGVVNDTALPATKTVDFTLDRPFIYMIRNTTTGSILIAGRFAQP